jgi:hypothetical protein
MTDWAGQSNALAPTVRIGLVGWFVFMAGTIALLRALGRGRCGWEPFTLAIMACTPAIFMSFQNVFHPEELLAMGLILGGLACAQSGRWLWSGVLLALAVITQQFALLALAPLLVIAPRTMRVKFIAAALVTWALVVLPLTLLTSGRALKSVLYGSSKVTLLGPNNALSTGGTVLWELHLHGALLFTLSRVVPIVLAITITIWALRRLGAAVLEPMTFLSLIATTICLRLVFEENLFGYYFIAIAAMLIVLDVVRGRLRGYVVAWIALVALVFDPVPWGQLTEHKAVPIVIGSLGLLVVLADIIRRRTRWYWVLWLLVVILTCEPAVWRLPLGHQVLPNSLWQVVLVGIALALAAGPLASALRASPRTATTALTSDNQTVARPSIEP